MNLLTAEDLSKSFTEKMLFDHISFGIQEGDKIGVIGVNGTGKSTLLKAVAGIETLSSGQISTRRGLKMAYLPQLPTFTEGTTVLQQVFGAAGEALDVVRQYEEALYQAKASPSEKADKEVALIAQQMEKEELWEMENEAKTILTKLGIKGFTQDVSTLSGGQRKRVALATALIQPVDILILDEPTNHIDNQTVEWLEEHLSKYSKALVMVTHDRYFLDRVANKTFELDKGRLFVYQGNYSSFLEAKAQREQMEEAQEAKRSNLYRRELAWIRRGAQARSTKQKARIGRFEEIAGQSGPKPQENVQIGTVSSRLGKKTIEIKTVSKGYHGITYIDQFSYIVLRNDRIGIVGENGCGKSTLMQMMAGRLACDSGSVEIGETVKVGFFSQEQTQWDESMRAIDYIKEGAQFITTVDGKVSASQMLERFLFDSVMQWSPIGKLSGGERRRLYLLRVLMEAPNILFLDEPTNDLDIQTLSILEEYLEQFEGAVITVSHDRYFLDRTVNRLFAFENGEIHQYEGDYSAYISKRTLPSAAQTPEKTQKQDMRERKKVLKMSYQEQRDFDSINEKIEEAEEALSQTEAQMALCSHDYVKLQEWGEKKELQEHAIAALMERWVYLNELAQQIETQKR